MEKQKYFQFLRKICTKSSTPSIYQAKSKLKKKFHIDNDEIDKIFKELKEDGLIQITSEEISINFLANSVRKEIYDRIKSYPGLNINNLKKQLNFGSNQLLWHLGVLQNLKLIKSVSIGKIISFGKIDIDDSKIKFGYLLLKDSIRKLIEYLIKFPHGQSEMEIAVFLYQPRSSINYSLKKLMKMNIIKRKLDESNLNLYFVNKSLIQRFEERINDYYKFVS